MRLEILQVPGCPNVALLEQRLEKVLADQQSEVEISHRVIDDPAVATDAGMTGSPTLLVDGVDPFAEPGSVPSVSCRLYPSGGAPSVVALRQALHLAAVGEAGQPADGLGDCCPADAAGESPLSGWVDGAARRDQTLRPSRRFIMRFCGRSRIAAKRPRMSKLDSVAAEFGVSGRRVLDRLHAEDVIRLNSAGRIASAYPFSASPTPHQVRVGGETTIYAMCAVDALGMSAMLGTEVVIESADPVTGERIAVTVRGESATATRPPWWCSSVRWPGRVRPRTRAAPP
ncbi:organomercurial lyase [Rhodococcus sp. NPDC019627]|uniref:organomercurial lyase n=1 Tax=unclassified Rhodococcus (in: high G+C Gram-positive bacteria) TaxID=192944 RepID=UPI0033CC687E